jgi:geranylgeranyl diphosphate synthase type I
VDQFLAAVEAEHETQITSRAQALARYGFPALLGVDGINYAHQGGSRAIARLIATSYWAHGGDAHGNTVPLERMVLVAAAQETHIDGVLIHDDLMDRSATRRGRSSLHTHFQQLHIDSNWSGDSHRMGVALAQISGDALMAVAGDMFNQAMTGLTQPAAKYLGWWYRAGRIEQFLGQAMDTVYPYLPHPPDPEQIIEQALGTMKAKTARSVAALPLAMGAAGAGADRRECRIMMDIGLLIGSAYQLRDDLLGALGDPEQTGKPVGQDLTDGKRTVLVGLTMQFLDPVERRNFAQTLLRGDSPPVEARVRHLQNVIRQSGAVEAAETMIQERRNRAWERLEDSVLDPTGRTAITEACDWLLTPARL